MTTRSTAVEGTRASFVIGPRLKAARLGQGLTLQQVADAAAITKGYLSRLERDSVSPTVATLMVLCRTLDIEPSTVLAEEAVEVITKGEIMLGPTQGEGIRHNILTPTATKTVSVSHSELEPGASAGDELYPMFCETQTAYVLRGRIEILFSNRAVTLNTGQAITFPGREPHSYRNPDDNQSAEMIWVLAPALGR
ncbi:HTH-type transcriptional regulator PuuR [Arthrobacter sp. Bi83]|nr:helix-turn-helix domain-containing protein [Arthrobacter sp. Bi83]CAH0218310.1 HTH-type transcriptional regulator PuuR [Arthrobacter sp. Bi83]